MNYEVMEKDVFSNGNTGWICPVCGRGVAPWVSECSCYKKETINGTSTEQIVPKLNDYAILLNGDMKCPEAHFNWPDGNEIKL